MYKLSAREVARLKEAFDEFDTNKDGKITKREIRAHCKRMGETNITAFIESMMTTFDEDGDGNIQFKEFLRVST